MSVAANEDVSVELKVDTNNNEHNDDDSDDYFADVGFMFESQQPVRFEKCRWDVPTTSKIHSDEDITTDSNDCGNDHSDDKTNCSTRPQTTTTSTTSTTVVQIALHVADDYPGAVQSGHYLWPAATMLSEYLINHQHHQVVNDHPQRFYNTVIELGAGCAMVSFVALQLWKETLQCICITDHDPSTLVRARDNYETTMQQLFNNDNCLKTNDDDDENAVRGATCDDDDNDNDNCDEHLNDIINTITNIPVLFESLKWGDKNAVEKLLCQTLPERLPLDILIPSPSEVHRITGTSEKNHHHFDIILGSDLIYCKEVVRPLFTTAVQLMHSSQNENKNNCSYFILAQSFLYDVSTENEIDNMCMEFQLHRTIVIDFDDENTAAIGATDDNTTTSMGRGRIQEFCFKDRFIV